MLISNSESSFNERCFLSVRAAPWFLALFLLAGYYKTDPRLSIIQQYVDLTLLFLVLSVAVFIRGLFKKQFRCSIPLGFLAVALAFLSLASTLVIGAFLESSAGYGVDKAARFVVLTGWAFWGAVLLITDYSSLRRFSLAVVSISTVMALDALSKYPGAGRVDFVVAFGSNYIALARACGLGILTIVAFLLPTEQKRLVKIYLGIAAALNFWAMFSAGARGPVLALALSFVWFLLLSVRGLHDLKIDRYALWIGGIIFVVAGVMAVIGKQFFTTLFYRITVLCNEGGSSAVARMQLFKEALALWGRSPLHGIGTGQFGMAVLGENTRLYPHNIILELGAETGFLGVIAFMFIITNALVKGFVWLHNSGAVYSRVVTRYLMTVCIFTLLNAMVSGDINDNRLLFTFAALLGTCERFK